MFSKKQTGGKTAKDARTKDRQRVEKSAVRMKKTKPMKQQNPSVNKSTIKRTVLQTLPYEQFVSEYIMLVKSNVKIGKQTANLYSKSYLVPDINYSSLPTGEKETKLMAYIDLLNGFDSSASVQVTLHNTKINRKDFEQRVLLQYKDDGNDDERKEFNGILHDRLMLGQNGIQCKKYITITVSAIDFEAANTKFLNYESHLNLCTQKLGTEMIPLKANERVRILCDIFRGVNTDLSLITREEFARRSEKMLCCPEYFEFKKDYFMFNEKYARCLYFQKLPTSSVTDSIFKDILETNQTMIITKNIEFVDTADAIELVRRQITNMKQEEITKTKAAANSARGAFIDPIEGTELAENKAQAYEFLEDLQGRNQKMTLCQFIIMITADSHDELEKNTETLRIIARKNQITLSVAPYRQEQAFASFIQVKHSILRQRTPICPKTQSKAVLATAYSVNFLHKLMFVIPTIVFTPIVITQSVT